MFQFVSFDQLTFKKFDYIIKVYSMKTFISYSIDILPVDHVTVPV